MSMTLEQVRDWHRELSSVRKKHPVFAAQAKKHADMADAIDAHLARPAQSVDGVSIIAAERQRQIEQEGWSPEHDRAQYEGGELGSAAACYAMPPGYKLRECTPPLAWPWEESWWKPGDRLRELAKAGALIAAEIDRLTAALQEKGNGP